jgi:hypothetical protein
MNVLKIRSRTRTISSIVASVVALMLLYPGLALAQEAGQQQKTDTVFGGVTRVTLSSGFLSALSSLGVTPGTVAPTRIDNGIASFPITGGAVDLNTAAGNIIHSGGLTLKTENTQVRLQSFIIDTTGNQQVLTGLVVVNGALVGRIPLFNLTAQNGPGLPLKPQGQLLRVTGIRVQLSSAAASALNSVFSVSAFTPGFDIGTANTYAYVGNGGSF